MRKNIENDGELREILNTREKLLKRFEEVFKSNYQRI